MTPISITWGVCALFLSSHKKVITPNPKPDNIRNSMSALFSPPNSSLSTSRSQVLQARMKCQTGGGRRIRHEGGAAGGAGSDGIYRHVGWGQEGHDNLLSVSTSKILRV